MRWVVGQQAQRSPANTGQRGVDAQPKATAQYQQTADIDDALHRFAGVVHAQPILWHHIAQGVRVRCGELGNLVLTALKERQVMARCGHGLCFVVHQNIDDAIGVLNRRRADLLRLEDTEAAALDHRRTTHADVAGVCGDHHIAATQQCRVAGKAAPCGYAHQGHLPVKPRQAGKGAHMQTRHDGHIHIARAAATAFGKQHQGQFVLQRQAQHAVGLLVIAHALGTSQYGGVVSHDHGRAAVHLAQTSDHAVGRRVLNQILFGAAAALRGYGQRAIFNEAARVAQVC